MMRVLDMKIQNIYKLRTISVMGGERENEKKKTLKKTKPLDTQTDCLDIDWQVLHQRDFTSDSQPDKDYWPMHANWVQASSA